MKGHYSMFILDLSAIADLSLKDKTKYKPLNKFGNLVNIQIKVIIDDLKKEKKELQQALKNKDILIYEDQDIIKVQINNKKIINKYKKIKKNGRLFQQRR